MRAVCVFSPLSFSYKESRDPNEPKLRCGDESLDLRRRLRSTEALGGEEGLSDMMLMFKQFKGCKCMLVGVIVILFLRCYHR